ncbi:MAG: phosphate regulon sensor histidine kinase PhoR [Gammaproteobacteria bacterium]|nr:phosphate regulon sensor histidine kinase PhoR [Gammaproteobacteria bacterium]MCP5137647.1 phosphate regulon sensor histidine kinase PhoR [Gammaproteobacteria bacterium]
MIPSKRWGPELWRFLIFVLTCWALGWWFGYPTPALIAALIVYIAWGWRNLHKLEQWLNQSNRTRPPPVTGIWEYVFNDIYALRLRYRRRKRRLGNIIKRFRRTTGALPDATVLLDDDGAMEWFNGPATQVLGLARPRDVGQRLEHLLRHPDFIEFLRRRELEQTLEIASPVDPRVTLLVRLVPLDKDQLMVIFRDVSQRRRLEVAQRDFVANVSHELRTPLTVVRGYVEALQGMQSELPELVNSALAEMERQSLRMEGIVRDLLTLSRLEAAPILGEVERIEVVGLLEDVIADARALSEFGAHRIHLNADSALALHGNREQLLGAFANLVVNAVRHTPNGAEITVNWARDGDGARLAVRDDGDGISPEHLSRLGERFYRADPSRSRDSGGTGLGLAIVKEVLERHHGRLEIHSRVGVGSEFICVFDAAALSDAAP